LEPALNENDSASQLPVQEPVPDTPTLYPSGVPRLLYLIKQVELAAKQHFAAILEPHGVTVNQFTALTVLARNPGMTSARLARNSFVRLQSMAQTMATLEGHGLIHREVDPESRRQFRTSITPAGRALMRGRCAAPARP
jgi:DNA-binding MarR family transcriptional regulator